MTTALAKAAGATETVIATAAPADPPNTAANRTSFRSKLEARVAAADSLLCVGLDPHFGELFPSPAPVTNAAISGGRDPTAEAATFLPPPPPTEEELADAAYTFCKTLIDATSQYAACYKPNAAFFEAIGPKCGAETLRRVIHAIPPDIPVLLDSKRGDIGTTASAYAKAAYEGLGADAVTLSPLMGLDSVLPFVSGKYAGRGAFLLCKTSNPGSQDLLALRLSWGADGSDNRGDEEEEEGETLYERIAHLVGNEWSRQLSSSSSHAAESSSLLGLVVGATDPDALRRARARAGREAWILAPGVGAQGGDLLDAVRAGMNDEGSCLLLPVSRAISRADDPASAARDLWEQIQAARGQARNIKQDDSVKEKSTVGCNNDVSFDVMTTKMTLLPHQQEFLEFSLAQGVLKFGSFVLKSGRTSPYFFNAGLFSSGAALYRLGKAYASAIMTSSILADATSQEVTFDVIFGPAYKGISLGAVVSSALHCDFGVDVGFAYNRKEAKDHGEGGTLVGASMKGKRILIVDDVITAGTAIREACTLLHSIGAQPLGVVIALDRAEVRSLEDPVSAVQAVARDLSLPVVSIVSLSHLQLYLESGSDYDKDILKSLVAYRETYGV